MLCSVGVFARAKQMLVCRVASLVERCYTCLWLLSALCWLVVNSGELLPELFSVGIGGSESVLLAVWVMRAGEGSSKDCPFVDSSRGSSQECSVFALGYRCVAPVLGCVLVRFSQEDATCNLSCSGGDRLAVAFPSALQFPCSDYGRGWLVSKLVRGRSLQLSTRPVLLFGALALCPFGVLALGWVYPKGPTFR
ncbi:hypothetical protein Taro_022340 [Colocasia esculenta]|uniref:Uncharacterized protein n=1 Tax=Colocasia esculenta TaxID=4460 RepID=A0A843VE63_COLES|nr:hypothetical protein [Colocasia esculenta]